MSNKVKYLIFFSGLLFVGVIVYLSLLYKVFWGYLFTFIPILIIIRVVDKMRRKTK